MPSYSNNSTKRLATLIIVTMGMLLSARSAHALTLSPVRMEISGNPGETLNEQMLLTNESEGETTYYSSFTNFEASGESGEPSFVPAKDDLGTWITTDPAVTLESKATKTVQFTVNIPKDAEPGGHFAAIFWAVTPNSPQSGVAIGARTGTLVLLSVNGDVKESGGLVDFSTKDHKVWYNTLPVSFTYRFKNDGGDRVKPVGKITMHDFVYLPADRIDANPTQGNILPKSTRRFETSWIKHPRGEDYVAPVGMFAKFFDQAIYEWRNFAIGPYFAKLNILYGTEATRVTKTAFFFVFPWQLIICLLVIITVIWFGGKKLIKRYNKHIIQKASAGINTPTDATHV